MRAPEPEPTRAKKIQDSGGDLILPPVRAEQQLIRVLFEAGPVMHTGMGAVPITEQELLAWQQNAGLRLTPWQAATVRRLSKEYAAEQRRAEDPDAGPPWTDRPITWDRDTVGKQVSIAFRALARASGHKRTG